MFAYLVKVKMIYFNKVYLCSLPGNWCKPVIQFIIIIIYRPNKFNSEM